MVENANLHNGHYLIDDYSHPYTNPIEEQSNYTVRGIFQI